MHIEPGVVEGAKIIVSYATAAASLGFAVKLAYDNIRSIGSVIPLLLRSTITTGLVFSFFQILPHHPVGVSEVHLILGSTLLLLFGASATAIGLACGLLLQGLFFAPFDLPQYGMNLTTLLVPLFAINLLSKTIIPPSTVYTDVKYSQALAISTAYQGGIVLWVAFWAFYGRGFGAENLVSVVTFGAAYMSVVIIEPLVDLAVLAAAKTLRSACNEMLFETRLHRPA